jgi:chorismate-pyruvate lyase
MAKSKQTRAKKSSRHPSRSKTSLLYPLDVAYEQAGLPIPKAKEVSPREIPFPYRSLLVHENDMTLTLERHFGGRVVLRTLSTVLNKNWYMRRVLLVQEYTGRPVEMGAIRLSLESFTARVRTQIERNEIPLGRILRDGDVDFKSQPRAFLLLEPNSEMMGVFWMREAQTLYGRQTELYKAGNKIGDIVEILPLV